VLGFLATQMKIQDLPQQVMAMVKAVDLRVWIQTAVEKFWKKLKDNVPGTSRGRQLTDKISDPIWVAQDGVVGRVLLNGKPLAKAVEDWIREAAGNATSVSLLTGLKNIIDKFEGSEPIGDVIKAAKVLQTAGKLPRNARKKAVQDAQEKFDAAYKIATRALATTVNAEFDRVRGLLGWYSRTNEPKPAIPSGFKSWADYLRDAEPDMLNQKWNGIADSDGKWKLAGAGMGVNAHAHHIVMKGNRFEKNFLARQFLWKVGINPFTSTLNLAWGPNWRHSELYAEKVFAALTQVARQGKGAIVGALENIARLFAAGAIGQIANAGDQDDDT